MTTNENSQGKTQDFVINNGVLEKYIGNDTVVVIPDGVKEIGVRAFQKDNEVVKVILPESVTEICRSAFENCSTLCEISIPESVKRIGQSAFMGCTSLENIKIPTKINILESYTFCDCSSLADINVPEEIEEIEAGAFKNCTALKKLIIPEKVNCISPRMLCGCTSLETITFSENVKIIGLSAFEGCTVLKEINVTHKNFWEDAAEGMEFSTISVGSRFNEIKIPYINFKCNNSDPFLSTKPKITSILENIEIIDEQAFGGCISLENIALSKKVYEIGKDAFRGCNQLIIYTTDGCYAEKYAKKKGIKVITNKEDKLMKEKESFVIESIYDFDYQDSVNNEIHYTHNEPRIGIDIYNVKKGDIVYFGKYEQDCDEGNGEEDIEWIVLKKEKEKVLVVARYGIDCIKYNDKKEEVTWETCSLRKWLNADFIQKAFNEEERALILEETVRADVFELEEPHPGNNTTDKIFLLSLNENDEFMGDMDGACLCNATEYAQANGAELFGNVCYWWLRTPLDNHKRTSVIGDYAATIYAWDVHDDIICIRPAMWIKLN